MSGKWLLTPAMSRCGNHAPERLKRTIIVDLFRPAHSPPGHWIRRHDRILFWALINNLTLGDLQNTVPAISQLYDSGAGL